MIDTVDISYDEHRLFHRSPKQFSFPSREEIFKAREWSQWHPNGVLGLWCSTLPEMCSVFGGHLYEVEMKPESRVIGLPFEDFKALTHHMEDFTDLIAYLCDKGDIAYIIDNNPFVGEVIVLNFDKIAVFQEVSPEGLSDARSKLVVVV